MNIVSLFLKKCYVWESTMSVYFRNVVFMYMITQRRHYEDWNHYSCMFFKHSNKEKREVMSIGIIDVI